MIPRAQQQKANQCQVFGHVLSLSVVFWHLLSYHHVSAVVINTTQGVIQGFTQDGASVFLGIPYAQPPIGQLRFKPTVFPAESWSGILNASEFGNVCYQILWSFMSPDEYPVSEDCLYLNVFTPNAAPSAQLPVMVWIHGGGFVYGSSTQHGVDGIIENFCTRGVVVVTINYRLGIFGFFSTEDSEIPGNYGVYDQIAALKWVQKEITRFGGDPNNVIMFGESAGAVTLSLLTMSPLAKGLYSKAIMESGSALGAWFFPGYEGYSKDVATNVGCITEEGWNTKQTKGLLECLQQFDSRTLFQAAAQSTKYYPASFDPFHPVVDGEGGVMPDVPDSLAKSRHNVPLLIGTTHDEDAAFYLGPFAHENYTYENFTKEFFETTMQTDLLPPLEAYGEEADEVAEKIKKAYGYYSIPPNDNMQWLNATIQMGSGNKFFAGAVKDAEAALNNGNENVFLYSFDYISDGYPYKQGYKAAYHCDELYYLFKKQIWSDELSNPWKWTANDRKMSEQMSIFWTNFAKSGNPVEPTDLNMDVQWLPISGSNPGRYLSIDIPSAAGQNYHKADAELWNIVIPNIVNATN